MKLRNTLFSVLLIIFLLSLYQNCAPNGFGKLLPNQEPGDSQTPLDNENSIENTNTEPNNNSETGTGTNNNNENFVFNSFQQMCAQSGVLFCDDFETGIKANWQRDGGDVKLISDKVGTNFGLQALQLSTYQGNQSSKLLYSFSGVDEIYIRYDVKYDINYDNSAGSHGPVIAGSHSPPWGHLGKAGITPGLGTTRVDGEDISREFFVANLEPTPRAPLGCCGETSVGKNDIFGLYIYFVGMSGIWGNWRRPAEGMSQPLIQKNKWFCVEHSIKLNSPSTSESNIIKNGSTQYWVDGVLYGPFTGISWRVQSNLKINSFQLDSYNHFEPSWGNINIQSSQPNKVYYDNIVISTQRIGCLK